MITYYTKEGKFESKRSHPIPYSKLHRVDGPAIICSNGTKEWWVGGERHREDGPAIAAQLRQEWWLKGKRHREDGPAFISSVKKEWWLKGKRHRIDGPAFINFELGVKLWYYNDKLHRENGPAATYANGGKGWYINGKKT